MPFLTFLGLILLPLTARIRCFQTNRRQSSSEDEINELLELLELFVNDAIE